MNTIVSHNCIRNLDGSVRTPEQVKQMIVQRKFRRTKEEPGLGAVLTLEGEGDWDEPSL